MFTWELRNQIADYDLAKKRYQKYCIVVAKILFTLPIEREIRHFFYQTGRFACVHTPVLQSILQLSGFPGMLYGVQVRGGTWLLYCSTVILLFFTHFWTGLVSCAEALLCIKDDKCAKTASDFVAPPLNSSFHSSLHSWRENTCPFSPKYH